MSVSCGQGSEGRSTAGGAAIVNYITAGRSSRSQLAAGGSSKSRLAAGRAARVSQLLIKQQGLVNCRQSSRSRLAAGRAVEVGCGAAGRQQGVGLAAGRSSKISVNCGQSSNG